MGHYGASTPKRHKGFTNNAVFARLDLGPKGSKPMKNVGSVQTVKKYFSKAGKPSWCGTKALKATQSGGSAFASIIYGSICMQAIPSNLRDVSFKPAGLSQ